MDDISEIKAKLQKQGQKGLALDIDETLSWTIGYWVGEFIRKFGNPENLTVKEIVAKYRYSQNIPYWQTPEMQELRKQLAYSDSVQEELQLIENSNHIVEKINGIIPVRFYLTARPSVVNNGTLKWLRSHGFPDVPIIHPPEGIAYEEVGKWKADVLQNLYPEIAGIIDDNPALAEALPPEYKGVFFLYDYHQPPRDDINVVACRSWEDVLTEVSKRFS